MFNANQSSRDKIYLTLIYNMEEGIKEENWESERKRERERERMRGRTFFFFSGCLLQETGSPFIGFSNGFH